MNVSAGRAVYLRGVIARRIGGWLVLVELIRRAVEGFLEGRDQGPLGLRLLATPVLIGAILVVGWLLIELLTIPRISSTGPVVRNGVAAVMVCGKKMGTAPHSNAGMNGLQKATKYAPEPAKGTWAPSRRGDCTIWYHHPPGIEQRIARQERADQ